MRDVLETIPDIIAEPMARCPDYPDYPTAWAIQKDRGSKLEHHPRCSSVPGWRPLSGPGLLCDCGAVEAEWQRLTTRRTAHAFLEGGKEDG